MNLPSADSVQVQEVLPLTEQQPNQRDDTEQCEERATPDVQFHQQPLLAGEGRMWRGIVTIFAPNSLFATGFEKLPCPQRELPATTSATGIRQQLTLPRSSNGPSCSSGSPRPPSRYAKNRISSALSV